jgi:hypothetical protein
MRTIDWYAHRHRAHMGWIEWELMAVACVRYAAYDTQYRRYFEVMYPRLLVLCCRKVVYMWNNTIY